MIGSVISGFVPSGNLPAHNSNAITSRLLVNIDPQASFSPEQFATASSAALIHIDKRNPYKSFYNNFLENGYVVISESLNEEALQKLSKKYGYRFVNFFNESLDEAVKSAQTLRETNPKYISDIPPLPSEVSQGFYQLMEKVDRVFTKHKLTYWLGGGTLLGAIRHQGMIKHDDDLDTYILDFEEYKIQEMQDDLAQEGLSLYKKDIYVIYETNGTQITHQPYKFPCLDVFVMELEKNQEEQDVYAHKAPYFYYHFRSERFTQSQIENIHRVPFGNLNLPIPADAEEYLNVVYGTPEYPDLWKKYALEPGFNHCEGIAIESPGACLVEINDYQPAPWK